MFYFHGSLVLDRFQLLDGDVDRFLHLLDILLDIISSTVLVTFLLIGPVLNDTELVVSSLLNLLEQLRGLTKRVFLCTRIIVQIMSLGKVLLHLFFLQA